jgi:hypothetical protein
MRRLTIFGPLGSPRDLSLLTLLVHSQALGPHGRSPYLPAYSAQVAAAVKLSPARTFSASAAEDWPVAKGEEAPAQEKNLLPRRTTRSWRMVGVGLEVRGRFGVTDGKLGLFFLHGREGVILME